MFDLAWSEIALIGIVALIAIGPKDLPIAIKAVANTIKKARRMASEFQGHVDEMVREADLHEVRDQFNDIRNMDIKGKILGAVDGDGTLRRTINENPFNAPPPPVTPVSADAAPGDTVVPPSAEHVIAAPEPPPAFIPPAEAVPEAGLPAVPAAEAAPASPPNPASPPAPAGPPAMIPPTQAVADAMPETAPAPRELAMQPAPHA